MNGQANHERERYVALSMCMRKKQKQRVPREADGRSLARDARWFGAGWFWRALVVSSTCPSERTCARATRTKMYGSTRKHTSSHERRREEMPPSDVAVKRVPCTCGAPPRFLHADGVRRKCVAGHSSKVCGQCGGRAVPEDRRTPCDACLHALRVQRMASATNVCNVCRICGTSRETHGFMMHAFAPVETALCRACGITREGHTGMMHAFVPA